MYLKTVPIYIMPPGPSTRRRALKLQRFCPFTLNGVTSRFAELHCGSVASLCSLQRLSKVQLLKCNILVADMMESEGRIPQRLTKEKYALGIVTLFPSLQDPHGKTGYVYMVLIGEDGFSQTRELHVPGCTLFRRNSQDTFIISAADSLGPVWGVHIWHDNSGPSPSWSIKHLDVSEVSSVTLVPESLLSFWSGIRSSSHKQTKDSVPPGTFGPSASVGLGHTKSAAASKLKLLQSDGWLDGHTVSLHFTLFSPAPNLFTSVTLHTEQSPPAGLLPSARVQSVGGCHSPAVGEYGVMVCQLLFLVLSLLQLCRQVYAVGEQGLMGYWRTPCNWLEVGAFLRWQI
ncbi:polycystic kidney disease 1 like 1-like isoform X2 [Gymnodraco acuticeps]|uniref:Polycystic kidney disease 1 like 1-like isoform X2 n=1 Tax=Gymnodraco acuticeps TaxID=8218 RepID=A0A6P8VEF9_GYMAC|nr:polycystic kidney disease 1 like 1-like isoform X2 [Gymnodraco acuticeps]